MAAIGSERINEYANAMFRHEELSEAWIASCEAYLRSLFGESLCGKTIIDYAFGRGNWSLAFRAAGAAKVIAIDASSDSVARFDNYCQRNGIMNIEVVRGNILETDIQANGDLIWVYGILPVIEEQTVFLNGIKSLAAGPDTQIYVYYYNANSLREFTVKTCRRALVYHTEREFREESCLFVRPARLRARDDLTAPCVNFLTAHEAKKILRTCGIYINRQDRDFQHFLHGQGTEDFYPHQFLCNLRADDETEIDESPALYAREVQVLHEVAQHVFSLPLSAREKRNIAIGLYNTHFAFLGRLGGAHKSVIEIFLLLIHILLQSGVKDSILSSAVTPYVCLFRAAVAGKDRGEKLRLLSDHGLSAKENKLMEFLISQSIRS